MPAPLCPLLRRAPLAVPIAVVAMLMTGCLPSPEGGGVRIDEFLDQAEGPCDGDSEAAQPVELPLRVWEYDQVPFVSNEPISPDGVRVEMRVDEAVCYSDTHWDRDEIWVYGPPDAEIWLVMEGDGSLFPVRVVREDGSVWQGRIDANEVGRATTTDRSLLVTARILRSALAIQSALRTWLPTDVELPPLDIVWEAGVARECPACLVDGRVLISDENYDERGEAVNLASWAGVVERQVVRYVLHGMGAIDLPISGQVGQPEPAAEAWGQAAATFVVRSVTGQRSFLAPRGVQTGVGRQTAFDLIEFTWSPRGNGSNLSDPLPAPALAADLETLVVGVPDPRFVPRDVAMRVLLSLRAGEPEDNGAPGIDVVDFADALACEDLTSTQMDHARFQLTYTGRCRRP